MSGRHQGEDPSPVRYLLFALLLVAIFAVTFVSVGLITHKSDAPPAQTTFTTQIPAFNAEADPLVQELQRAGYKRQSEHTQRPGNDKEKPTQWQIWGGTNLPVIAINSAFGDADHFRIVSIQIPNGAQQFVCSVKPASDATLTLGQAVDLATKTLADVNAGRTNLQNEFYAPANPEFRCYQATA